MDIKQLGVSDADAVAAFLQDHYGRSAATAEMYIDVSNDYIRWLLSVADVWAMILYGNLVGLISVHSYVSQSGDPTGYIGTWCINEVGRSQGLGKQLLDHVIDSQSTDTKIAIPYLSQIDTPHSIPLLTLTIRVDVLAAMGLLDEETTTLLIGDDLGLRITREIDIPQIVSLLNDHPRSTPWSPKWTSDLATEYLLPAKNAIYSYVRRDTHSRVTDFIQGTAVRITYPDLGHTLFAVLLGSWSAQTVPLDELILSWVPHLAIAGVHQIIFPDTPYYQDIALPQQCLAQQMGICVPSGHPIAYPDLCAMPWI